MSDDYNESKIYCYYIFIQCAQFLKDIHYLFFYLSKLLLQHSHNPHKTDKHALRSQNQTHSIPPKNPTLL